MNLYRVYFAEENKNVSFSGPAFTDFEAENEAAAIARAKQICEHDGYQLNRLFKIGVKVSIDESK